MSDDRRGKLINLGAESLADALLELADQDEHVEDLVRRMISTRDENVAHFKEKLAYLSKPHKFVPWGRSADLVRELESALEDLKMGVEDPKMGILLTADFFRTDNTVFENSDTSNDNVGWVFTHNARNMFVSYASLCDSKRWIADVVLELIGKDDYAVRTSLIDCAVEYLPETTIRLIMDRLWGVADETTEEHKKRGWYRKIESLARQIKDAPGFEKARLASDPDVSGRSSIAIARVYLESGDAATALSWMKRVSDTGSPLLHDGNRLFLDIHKKLGNHAEVTRIQWKIFREHRSPDTLNELLDEIGHDQRDKVIEAEARVILESKALSYTDTRFLIEVGRLDEAESYLLERSDRINGDMYHTIVPLAEKLNEGRRYLTATILYRSLLDSILERAHWKAYQHGREYLGVLIELARSITDWGEAPAHESYVNRLLESHSRKRSFWQCHLD